MTVVYSIRIGVDNVVRKSRFGDSIRYSSCQLPSPELETDQGSQMEQVGVAYGLTSRDKRRVRSSGIGYRQLDLVEPSSD